MTSGTRSTRLSQECVRTIPTHKSFNFHGDTEMYDAPMKRPLAEEFEDVSPSEEICALNSYIDWLEKDRDDYKDELMYLEAGEDI